MPLKLRTLSRLMILQNLSASRKSLHLSVSVDSSLMLLSYTSALEKLSLHSLSMRRHLLDALFFIRYIAALNPAHPFRKILVFAFLRAMFETSLLLALVPRNNTVPLLGAPMLPTWLVKIVAININVIIVISIKITSQI
jgi:hypothetical protein